MSLGSWFTRAIDVVTPWNRGGEVQRNQERKRREDEERQRAQWSAPSYNRSNAPVQNNPQQNQQQTPDPEKPLNLFENLNVNKNLVFNKPQNEVDVTKNQDSRPVDKPDPGTIVKPKQSFFDKVRDQFDANTEADKYRRTVRDADKFNKDLLAKGLDKEKARKTAVKLSQSVNSNRYRSGIDDFRDATRDSLYSVLGKPIKAVATVPVEAGRETLAQITGNKEAERQANRRMTQNLYSKEALEKTDRGEKLGWMDLFGASADVLSVLPMLKGLGIAGKGAKQAVAARSFKPVIKGAAEGLDEAMFGLRNLFKRPNVVKEVGEVVDNAPRPIPVRENIPVSGGDTVGAPISVRNLTEPKPLIRELAGDARIATPDPLIKRFADDAREGAALDEVFEANRGVTPDMRIEGVTPRRSEPFKLGPEAVVKSQDEAIDAYAGVLRDVGEKNGVSITPDGRRVSSNMRFGDTGGKNMSQAAWREEAARQLSEGKADPEIQKVFDEAGDPEVQSLLAKGEQPSMPEGRPIQVKQVDGIPVRDETVVPQNLPEMPGTVRPTTATAPANAKTAQVAAQTPPALPREVQEVLDSPKQFSKRQVAAARNQRKLARQVAKTQEDTAEAMGRIETSKLNRVEGQSDEFAPTGEFARSPKSGPYETATRKTEQELGGKEMQVRSAEDLVNELSGRKSMKDADQRKIQAAKENLVKAGQKDSPLYKALTDRNISDRRRAAQILALGNRVIRKSATADTLTTRTINKIDDALTDGTKMPDADYKVIEAANTKYTAARDAASQAEEQYKRTHSKADLDAFKKAKKAEMDADLAAKTTEVKTAQRVLKGSKEENAAKVVNDLEKEADLNMMDYVTSSQLSGPATGSRNLVGTELAGVENRVGANLRAKIVKGIFGENVGGFDRSGARAGRKEGFSKMVSDAKRRAEYSGKNPFKHARNFGTTINTAGESSLHSTTQSRLKAYYKNQLKDQGVSGERLANDAEFLRLTDPDSMGEVFMDTAMKSSGLTGIYQKSQRMEHTLSKGLSAWLGKGLPPNAADSLAKGMVRIGLGYPTATANFLAQSGKRLLVGLPSAVESGIKALKGDKKGAALALDRALKEAGSGVAALTVGTALANADRISGFYPEDEDERQRWTDEGRSELSIKIGDAWHPIPQGFGMFGLPLIVAAQFKEGGADAVFDMFTTRKNISKLLPTDQISGTLRILEGDSTDNQDKSFIASTIRSFIPAGSFLNQTAKGLDETANDTSTKDFWRNVYDQAITGIPGVNNMSNIPDKVSSTGEPLRNPNLGQVYSGAQTVEQSAGVENSKKVDAEINATLSQIDKYGLLGDKNLDGVLEGSALEAFTKANTGQQLDESEIKALKEGLVKGVYESGADTSYLEKEQYDTNLAVLNMKRDLMREDPTTKPSNLKNLDTAITRGEVYRDEKMPYKLIKGYMDTSLTEWRNMGDPDHDDYDQKMYDRLWRVDELLTKAKVSDNYKGQMEKHKYSAKTSGSGRGGRGGRGRGGKGRSLNLSADFGALKSGGPTVREYDTIATKAGDVPIIRRTRPNIVHKITSSG